MSLSLSRAITYLALADRFLGPIDPVSDPAKSALDEVEYSQLEADIEAYDCDEGDARADRHSGFSAGLRFISVFIV
ncbi:MAG: hypothetical protein ABIO86_04310 [Sphingomonas sp.]